MNVVTFKFNTGDLLRDKITGVEGIVMARAHYATGCHHYAILPRQLKDGKEMDWVWLDQSRFEIVEPDAINFHTQDTQNGGPQPNGPKM